MENDVSSLMLEDEKGDKVKFQVVTKFDIEDREYIIVVPEENEDSKEAIVLKIVEGEDGREAFITVEDDEEFNQVSEVYEALFND
ncbi:DUF1292 domain-containing protein [Clostridium kluyveri]|uniref:UPF0473 protein CKL_1327 n=3 Tax=Clostridium kluyveri TaxID=1534 RepID=Y1327_CLOK5|nr:DUF1292 domain-containing protein [Clostridium kluyveri]A5N7T8.1 RecName: Full=UPF0473 protein CKL_1327 [Clostridium kluyveri DSM 555]B9E199.1 RecName: Full=UPF0473 protein CKR_1223 [Clostridium kluyveri NBRC 12016]APM38698.1 hypothetical protein BS101_08030 [Clostridium kluyveri]EDK33369.1 Conserved hypothetical protein [Clostridium kluyveri DSM 555]UZQ51014.1 DUF1292 domain-containing protein [Clostridium kluyveri]BAH06274.1 hypothetical protein CKR_1223 [Clostridium kluyveri NBRC 12016]